MEKYFLAYDIGGTDIKYAVLNRHGHLIEKHKVATPSTGTEIVEQLVEIKQSLENNYPFEGAAFSVPGMVAPVEGFLQTGGAIADFYGFPFREVLGAKLQMPVEVENDVNCVALAEKWLGKAKNCQNFLCVTIGTGVGGAVYANDQLVRGHANMAGEFGYMLTNACHNSQNQPTTLSFTGSIREGLRRQYIQRKQTLSIEDISGKDIYSFAEKGDEIAKQVIECFYKNIAVGLYNLIFILNQKKLLSVEQSVLDKKFMPRLKTIFND